MTVQVSPKVTLHIVLTISATPGVCLVPLELCVGGRCLQGDSGKEDIYTLVLKLSPSALAPCLLSEK